MYSSQESKLNCAQSHDQFGYESLSVSDKTLESRHKVFLLKSKQGTEEGDINFKQKTEEMCDVRHKILQENGFKFLG